MRILALMTDAYNANGGIAQYNRDLLTGLAQVAEVEVMARSGSKYSADMPAGVIVQGVSNNRLRFVLMTLRLLFTRPAFDTVFCGHLYMLPLAWIVTRLSGSALWLQIHGIEAWHSPGWLISRLASRVQLVTAVSRYTRLCFLRWSACSPEKVKVLPNTVADVFFETASTIPTGKSDPPVNDCVLLTVSRLSSSERYKGHDRILDVLPNLVSQNPQVHYQIAGDGDDRERLELKVASLGLQKYVTFLGYVPDGLLPELFRKANIFVMPSTGEGFGIVYLQAIASGMQVIAGNSDGSCDPLRDGLGGALVNPDNPDELEVTIGSLMKKRESRQEQAIFFSRANFNTQVGQLIAAMKS